MARSWSTQALTKREAIYVLIANQQDGSKSPRDAASTAHSRRTRVVLTAVAILGWTCAVGVGLQRMWIYESTAGAVETAPAVWPGSSLVSPLPDRATLVMFVHPKCTCSRASLQELREIVDRSPNAASVWIVLLDPLGTGPDWERTSIVELAQAIGNVNVVSDTAGREAARFGASTSGHVVLYAADRKLLYSGGITGARGHVGDNEGRRSVIALLHGDSGRGSEHPIFGCGFHDPEPTPP